MRSTQNRKSFHQNLEENENKTIKSRKDNKIDKPAWETPLPDSDDD